VLRGSCVILLSEPCIFFGSSWQHNSGVRFMEMYFEHMISASLEWTFDTDERLLLGMTPEVNIQIRLELEQFRTK